MDADTATLLWRLLLTSMSSFLVGSTIVICTRYYRLWRASSHDWRGLLPLHVVVVTLSYDLLLIYATIEIYMKIGDDTDAAFWRGALLLPAYVFGFLAMYTISQLRKNRRMTEI